MKSKLCNWFLAVFCLGLTFNAFGQDRIEHIKSGEIIDRVRESYNDDEYEAALEALDSISDNDTNHTSVLYWKGRAFQKLKKWDEALAVYEEGIELKDANWRIFLCELAHVQISMGHAEAGFATFDKAIEIFPMSHGNYSSRAKAYVKIKEYEKAVKDYQKAIEINPYHAHSHFELGKLCAKEGLYTQAFLSMATGMLADPVSGASVPIFLYLQDTMLTSDYALDKQGRNLHPKGENKFSALDAAIKNRLAADKAYRKKVKYKYEGIYATTLHMVMNNLKYSAADKGWWMQTYVPMFKEILKRKNDDEAVYLSMFLFLADEKWMPGRVPAVKEFSRWFREEWSKNYTPRTIAINGSEKEYDVTWNAGFGVDGIGKMKNDYRDGYWLEFNLSGKVSAEGNYDEGNRTGDWTIYNRDGSPSAKYNFKDGEINGAYEIFYDNGNVKYRGTLEGGKLQGRWESFYKTGGIEARRNYKDGLLEGPYTVFYRIGTKFIEASYVNDELQGSYKKYFSNEKLSYECTYAEGEKQGKAINYFHNGQIFEELKYVDDELEGPFKIFHITGRLKEEGQFKKDSRAGVCKEYYPNGTLSQEATYDESGKMNGTSKIFSRDGKLYYELTYKRGEIIAYKFYNKDGKVIKEDTRSRGAFFYDAVYPDGVRSSKGKYEIGDVGQVGKWVHYNSNGKISQLENYDDDGYLDGERIYYYSKGQVSAKYEYEEGVLNGYYVSYYPDGKMQRQGWYYQGAAQGDWISYYRDGTIEKINFYLNDDLQGVQKNYSVAGKLTRSSKYDAGVLQEIVYYDLDEKPLHTAKLGLEKSEFKTTYTNGKTAWTSEQVNHQYHGKTIGYRASNGEKSYEGQYFNDQRQGEWKWFHYNGKLSTKGSYEFGDRNGKWVEYYDNGNISDQDEYIYGTHEGKSTEYFKDGKKRLEAFYVDGELHGARKFYSPDEDLSMIRYYNHGKIIGYGYHDKEGKEVEMKSLPNECGDVKCYFPNGQLSREYTLDSGLFVGKYTAYYANGQVYYTTNYESGYTHGTEITYHKNGKVESELPYDMGDLHGTCTYYRADGSKEKEVTYFYDVKHGTAKFYNSSGKVVKEEVWYDDNLMEVKKL